MYLKVVNMRVFPYDVYIGRGSKWGNPYSHMKGTKALYKVKTRAEAIEAYEAWIRKQPNLLSSLHELEGKVLGCYCRPHACHGDVLIKLIQEGAGNMALKRIDFDTAIDKLDTYLQAKTTHGTKDILATMQAICALPFVNEVDQNDFAQACRHFEMYVQATGKTSMGRKQFEEWWDIQGTGEAGEYSEEATTELQEDPLPDGFNSVGGMLEEFAEDSIKQMDLHAENIRLRAENEELRRRLKQIG